MGLAGLHTPERLDERLRNDCEHISTIEEPAGAGGGILTHIHSNSYWAWVDGLLRLRDPVQLGRCLSTQLQKTVLGSRNNHPDLFCGLVFNF
ncbi:hypothetical protein M758_8G020900 [Ceratodon purpureus]|nr:hypothetical protein M758_8G020900 [Ceratodon purpureus]